MLETFAASLGRDQLEKGSFPFRYAGDSAAVFGSTGRNEHSTSSRAGCPVRCCGASNGWTTGAAHPRGSRLAEDPSHLGAADRARPLGHPAAVGLRHLAGEVPLLAALDAVAVVGLGHGLLLRSCPGVSRRCWLLLQQLEERYMRATCRACNESIARTA